MDVGSVSGVFQVYVFHRLSMQSVNSNVIYLTCSVYICWILLNLHWLCMFISPKFQCDFYWHNNHILNYHSFKCKGRHLLIKLGIFFASLKRSMSSDRPNCSCIFSEDVEWVWHVHWNWAKICYYQSYYYIYKKSHSNNLIKEQYRSPLRMGWLKHSFGIIIWFIVSFVFVKSD